jgi:hypothetical protein
MATQHVYWAADCKTEGCETQIFLKYVGIYEPTQTAFLVDLKPEPINVPCGICGETHAYTKDELEQRISDDPPEPHFADQF